MEIGLGSLVVHSAGSGLILLVAATAGDEMFCVSTDQQKSIRQWCHRSALQRAQRGASRPS